MVQGGGSPPGVFSRAYFCRFFSRKFCKNGEVPSGGFRFLQPELFTIQRVAATDRHGAKRGFSSLGVNICYWLGSDSSYFYMLSLFSALCCLMFSKKYNATFWRSCQQAYQTTFKHVSTHFPKIVEKRLRNIFKKCSRKVEVKVQIKIQVRA